MPEDEDVFVTRDGAHINSYRERHEERDTDVALAIALQDLGYYSILW